MDPQDDDRRRIAGDAMTFSRPSTSGLMGLVAFAAADLMVFRLYCVDGPPKVELLVLGLLPMATILGLALPPTVRRLGREGEVPPFWTGFQLLGWATVLAYASWSRLTGDWLVESYDDSVFDAFDRMVRSGGWDNSGVVFWLIVYPISAAFLLVPQLVVALLGGLLFKGLDIRFVVGRRRAEGAIYPRIVRGGVPDLNR
jgi:hypothetical protein